MSARFLSPLALLLACAPTPPVPPGQAPADLVGTWEVDLRPTPAAPAYTQTFTVTRVEGRGFEGNFYDTPLREGRINVDWGALHFAFVTSDDSGVYHHAGSMSADGLHGTSHSLGRGFLAVWTARRVGR